MNADEALAWLDSLQGRGVRMGLDAMHVLLRRLDDPHAAYEWVHVGGTNGKGSVAAMCEAALLAAGHDVGLYTSPHLVRFHERVRVGGRDMTDEELVEGVARLRPAVEAVDREVRPVSYFEAATALAFDRFAAAGVDVAVVEVGLGGRLDATNVHPAPLVTVLTNVGRDHQKLLGEEPTDIAREKAGILRAGVPAVTGATDEALKEIEARAAAVGAPLRVLHRDVRIERSPGTAAPQRVRVDGLDLDVGLAGPHQAENAALALEALRAARAGGVPVPDDAIRAGLRDVRWRGRLQEIPGTPPLLLDGAHNPDAVEAVVRHLKERGLRPVVLFGVLADKRWMEMVLPLAEIATAAVCTRPPSPRALEPRECAREFSRVGVVSTVVEDPGHALATAEAQAGPEGLVVVTGSLYLVGDVLDRREDA